MILYTDGVIENFAAYFLSLQAGRFCIWCRLPETGGSKTGTPQDPYTRGLQDRVEAIRSDDEWRENYMTIEMKMEQRYEQGRKQGLEEGREQGERNGRHSILRAMLEAKLDKEIILKAGFTEEEIEEFPLNL